MELEGKPSFLTLTVVRVRASAMQLNVCSFVPLIRLNRLKLQHRKNYCVSYNVLKANLGAACLLTAACLQITFYVTY